MLRGCLNQLTFVLTWFYENTFGLLFMRQHQRLTPPPPQDEPAPQWQPEPEELIQGVHCLCKPDEGKEPDFDVVFIHGLGLHADKQQWLKTWRTRDGTQCWPQTWLRMRFPRVRVLAISYNSSATNWGEKPMSLWQNAINYVNMLLTGDVGLGDRPYFLVGHSMGGLLAKEVLMMANSAAFDAKPQLRDNCKGIVFYGVPHLGANLAEIANFINNAVQISGASVLVTDELRLLGEACYRRNMEFNPLERKYHAYHFIETEPILGMMVVPKEIAGFNAAANNMVSVVGANHITVCKPAKMTDTSFAMCVNFLKGQLDEAKINVQYIKAGQQQPEESQQPLDQKKLE